MKSASARRKSDHPYHPYQQTVLSSTTTANGETPSTSTSGQTYRLQEIRAMKRTATKRKTKETEEYLCRWEGYGTQMTWEPASNLPPITVENFRKAQSTGDVDVLLLLREMDNFEFTLHEMLRDSVEEFTVPLSASICNSEWGDCAEVSEEDVERDERLRNMKMLTVEDIHESLDNPLCYKLSKGRYRCPVFPIYFRPLVKSCGLMMQEVVTIFMRKETLTQMPMWVKDPLRVFEDRRPLKPVAPVMTRSGIESTDNNSNRNVCKTKGIPDKHLGPTRKQSASSSRTGRTADSQNEVFFQSINSSAGAKMRTCSVAGMDEEDEMDREVALIFSNEKAEEESSGIIEIDPPVSANELKQVERVVRRSGSWAREEDWKPAPIHPRQRQTRGTLQPLFKNFLTLPYPN